jgi:Protein of unknown function with PCYCGC motif
MLILLSTILIAAVVASCSSQEQARYQQTTASKPQPSSTARQVAPRAPQHEQADAHGHDTSSPRVPAFQSDAASLKSLAPTLSPAQFSGNQRAGYQAVKEIPRTIAQLPCYCHCDEGFGHKSLHSCFEDEHAAHCAVCIDEALVAYQLEKQEGLKPEQIRERIVEQFTN